MIKIEYPAAVPWCRAPGAPCGSPRGCGRSWARARRCGTRRCRPAPPAPAWSRTWGSPCCPPSRTGPPRPRSRSLALERTASVSVSTSSKLSNLVYLHVFTNVVSAIRCMWSFVTATLWYIYVGLSYFFSGPSYILLSYDFYIILSLITF